MSTTPLNRTHSSSGADLHSYIDPIYLVIKKKNYQKANECANVLANAIRIVGEEQHQEGYDKGYQAAMEKLLRIK